MSTETSKSFERRMREGWFSTNTQNLGIDIGCGSGPITDECEKWDLILGNSDATFMDGIKDEVFWYAYSSHLLEHLDDPVTALRNWWRIIQAGGRLIVVVPHRDLYEKKTLLPSRFNLDHKHFFLPISSEPPHTIGLLDTFEKAIGRNYTFISLKVLDDGYKSNGYLEHASGEYSIELIVKKPITPVW